MIKEVIKRNGRRTKFIKGKIRIAIQKANKEVPITEQATDEEIDAIIKDISAINDDCLHIEVIQDLVETNLMQRHRFELAKKYIIYRYVRSLSRDLSDSEASILGILNGTNLSVIDENSNKNSYTNSTQRDLMAGESSKAIARKILLPQEIQKANEDCIIHWHDEDYTAQSMVNCFRRSTKFITNIGIRSFEDFSDGSSVLVPGHDGDWHPGVVHNFGTQPVYKYTLRMGESLHKEVYCTKNHTWLLSNGERTTSLGVGDTLFKAPAFRSFDFESADTSIKYFWFLGYALGGGSREDADTIMEGGSKLYPPKTAIHKAIEDKVWRVYTLDERVALFDGYLSVCGEYDSKDNLVGILSLNKELLSMVHELAEVCGYYLGVEDTFRDDDSGSYIYTEVLNNVYNNELWTVDSISYVKDEEVWCLEVEDCHSFILTNGVVTGNCCLINVKDVLDRGTVLNNVLVQSPKSFRTSCSILTQIVANIASNQYGGQSINIKHLGKYLAISEERFRLENRKRWDEVGIKYTEEQLDNVVAQQLKYELEQGIQTIQFQLVCLMTVNGQAPFVTLFLQLDESDPYLKYTAMIIEEIIRQRIVGVKNEKGVYVTPAFPKLVYVLDEHNCLEGGKYDYITKLAARCTIKRSYPDYISAKKMREEYDGEVFSPMGCRSFLSPWRKTDWYVKIMDEPESEIGKYLWEGRFNQGRQNILCPLSA